MNHPYGIRIQYKYDGDEAPWRDAIQAFVTAIDDDPDVAGKFKYSVATLSDGVTRLHIGQWDNDDSLKLMQSRPYFPKFAAQLKEMAGDTLEPIRFSKAFETRA
jgi:quinol monooxygenase YgiN